MRTQQEIPLNYRFRFIHEPLGTSLKNEWRRFVGRDLELDELVSRILLSDGGAFLVTGYRGVGKTTFVNGVVQRLEERIPGTSNLIGPTEILSVYLNFARPMKPTELMFHILRGLRLQLAEKGLLNRLDSKVRDQLELAFMRTSLSMGYKASDETERSLELGEVGLKLPFLIGSKLKIGHRHTSGLSREYSYLAYDDKAAEYDLIQITRQLSKGYRKHGGFWRKLLGRGPAHSSNVRLKMLFVFDELDKIEEVSEEGRSPIDEILGSLKNVFTTSGISFIFVAGRDTHERWLEDLGRGDSVYESIFTYAHYLPALWAHVDGICDELLANDEAATSEGLDAIGTYLSFKKFLAFKGRGIPRRIIRGFNDYVHWDGDQPCLRFSAEHSRQFNFYAKLYDVLILNEERLFGNYHDESPALFDQQHLSVYYLVDWILRAGLGDFSADEAIAAARKLSRLIAPTEQLAPQVTNTLLQVLIRNEYVEEIAVSRVAQEIGPGGGGITEPVKRYRIVRRRLAEMGRLNGLFDEEAKAGVTLQPAGIPAERYNVVRHIGRGGMSNVYEAVDRSSGRHVAIKQILAELSKDESYRNRFRREAEILANLRLACVVNVFDIAMDVEQPYIVMEYVQGIRLTDLIKQGRTNELSQFLHIARDLLSAVQALHDRGVLWADPKPGNIMVTTEGRLVLLDFGISRLLANTIDTRVSVGTPAYMSPEAVLGKGLDARSDLYSIGVILFEMLAGRLPFDDPQEFQLAEKQVSTEPPALSNFVDVPPEIEHVVMRCLNKAPEQRFQSATDILEALPEAANVTQVRTAAREAYAAAAENSAREASPTVFGLTTTLQSASTENRTQYLTAPPPPPAPAPAPYMPNCLTFSGPLPTYYLNPQRNTLGRSANNDVVLDEAAASRYHAVIRPEDGHDVLEDLNTANGTYVNHERIQGPRRLKNGDRIQIGKTVITYHGPVGD